MEYLVKNLEEMEIFAQQYSSTLIPRGGEEATVIGLSGDLGSGKTAFTKALAGVYGIHEEVLSPTFIIAKFYPLKGQKWNEFIHIDAYRIEDESELSPLRFGEMIHNPQKLIIIEWPEKLGKQYPAFACTLKFKFVDETSRMINT